MAEQTRERPKLRLGRLVVCAVVVLLAALVVVNLTVARLPAMPPADGKYISLHGKEIHYFEQPGQGVPVVMIRGQPGSHQDFDPVVAELPGLHLISIDRPGFGWSKGGWLPYPGADRRGPRVTDRAQTRSGRSRRALVRRHARPRCCAAIPAGRRQPDPRGARDGGIAVEDPGCAAGPLHPVQSVAGGTHDRLQTPADGREAVWCCRKQRCPRPWRPGTRRRG